MKRARVTERWWHCTVRRKGGCWLIEAVFMFIVGFKGSPLPPTQAPCTPALAHTSSLDTDLTRSTRAPHFNPQHWLLCHMGLY